MSCSYIPSVLRLDDAMSFGQKSVGQMSFSQHVIVFSVYQNVIASNITVVMFTLIHLTMISLALASEKALTILLGVSNSWLATSNRW